MVASYSSINSTAIKETPALSIDQYFQGRVSGMNVINRSGDPGSGAVSFLRGVNSINANNSPLYIVDGIPVMSPDVFGSNLDGYQYNTLLKRCNTHSALWIKSFKRVGGYRNFRPQCNSNCG